MGLALAVVGLVGGGDRPFPALTLVGGALLVVVGLWMLPFKADGPRAPRLAGALLIFVGWAVAVVGVLGLQ